MLKIKENIEVYTHIHTLLCVKCVMICVCICTYVYLAPQYKTGGGGSGHKWGEVGEEKPRN